MTMSQQLIVYWTEFAFAGTMILGVTKIVVHRLQQPIDRVNLILMSVFASVFVPLLLGWFSTPSLKIDLFSIGGNPLERVEAKSLLSKPKQHSVTTDASNDRTERQTNIEPLEAVESKPLSRSEPISVTDSDRDAVLTARSIESVDGGMIAKPNVWSIFAAILLATHGIVISCCFVQWIVGTVRLRNISNRAAGVDQSIVDLWNEVSNGRGRFVGPVRKIVSASNIA